MYNIACPAATLGKISPLSSFGIYPALQEAMGYTLPCSRLRKNVPSIKLWDRFSLPTNFGTYIQSSSKPQAISTQHSTGNTKKFLVVQQALEHEY
jgi:hypothetical protein